MKRILKYISAGAILASAVSCNMDLVPNNAITYQPGQQIITSESDLTGFEANIMACFRSLDYGDFDLTPDLMVDYFNAMSDYGNNYGPVHTLDANFTSGDYYIQDNWRYPYAYIKNFNIFIDGAKTVPDGLQEAAAVARGEAFLARAFAYMHLARHFGPAYSDETLDELCVPLVTVYDQNARPARATVAEVYGQIKDDLDSAAVLLADIPGEARAERPTIDAVNAMYARYYLDTRDYANAAASAMEVINSGHYALSSTPAQMEAEWLNDNGTEPIMQFYASVSEGIGTHSAYTQMKMDSNKGLYYQPFYIPSQKLIDAYDEGDLRFEQWFDGGDYPSYHNAIWYNDGEHDYYVFKKYYGNPALTTSNTPTSGHAVKPLLISEMYLIAAEAYFENGQASEAKTVLNALQTQRGAATTAATAETIHNEWYRETVGEGLRFSCLKRWGEGFDGRPAQPGAANVVMSTPASSFTDKALEADDYHFLWPIPTYEMQTNLNLKQNPGYGSSTAE